MWKDLHMENRPEQLVDASGSEINLGNSYEANQKMMFNVKPLTKNQIKDATTAISAWLGFRGDHKYFMLLCDELKDYTIYRLNNPHFNKCANLITENLQYRGTILSIDYNHTNDYYECWVQRPVFRNKDGKMVALHSEDLSKSGIENHMYILFEADYLTCEVE